MAEHTPQWLLGRWRLRQTEPGVEFQPDTVMEFHRHGELVYRIPLEGREHIFRLAYRVEGNLLSTDHAGAEHAQAVRFARTEEGLLEFDFAGARAWFAREPRA